MNVFNVVNLISQFLILDVSKNKSFEGDEHAIPAAVASCFCPIAKVHLHRGIRGDQWRSLGCKHQTWLSTSLQE